MRALMAGVVVAGILIVVVVMGGAVTLLGATPGTTESGFTMSAVSESTDAAAAAACPGLSWSVVAGVALLQQVTPAAAAEALCAAGTSTAVQVVGVLGHLDPDPHFIQEVLVVSEAVQDDPTIGTAPLGALIFVATKLGVPYLWGGTGPGGYDCSGLVQAAYRSVGVTIPRVAQDQFDQGPTLPPSSPLEPGDLIFFGSSTSSVDHVGIYVGGGQMIDAPHTGAVVRIEAARRSNVVGVTRPAA